MTVLGERVDPARGLRTPLSEGATIGAAVGIALTGKAVVVELVEVAGIARAWDSLAEAGAMRARSNGAWSVPLVVRVPLRAEDELPPVPPGVAVMVAAGAAEADRMVGAATGPTVLFVADGGASGDGEGPTLLRTGTGVTVLAYGAGVAIALEAAATRSVTVVDLRGVAVTGPAVEALRATGRVVIVGHGHPGVLPAVVEAGFWHLEGRPREVRAALGVAAVLAAIDAIVEE